MNAQTTLAVGVVAALTIPALLAQQQNTEPKPFYQYREEAPPAASAKALALPQMIHICFAGCAHGGGMTLQLENGRFVAKDARGVAAAYEVVKFTRESVMITRTDYRPRQVSATLTGRISEDGNALVDGKAKWPDALNPFQMAWGDAIDTVPGDDHGKPAIPACDAQLTAPADQALRYGDQAISAKRMKTAVCWLRIAAAQENAMAQGALALIYFTGVDGAPVDVPEAARLAQKSADAHNYLGDTCLGLMYENGRGMPKDPSKAALLREAADRDQAAQILADRQAAQQREVQAAAQQRQMQQGMSLLGLFLDAFSSGGGSPSGDNAWNSDSVNRESKRLNMSACGNPNMPPAACR